MQEDNTNFEKRRFAATSRERSTTNGIAKHGIVQRMRRDEDGARSEKRERRKCARDK